MPRKTSYKRKKWNLDLSHLKIDTSMLDDWQKEVFTYLGSLSIRAGRQTGKSFSLAKKIAQFALNHKNLNILITAAAERESSYLYEKVRFELEALKEQVFAEKPTMGKIFLKNNTNIFSMPTGRTGNLIRGLTIDVWIPDECAFIGELVFISIIPMLAVSKKERGFGWIWAASTPWGSKGFFYDTFRTENTEFKNFHITAEKCERIPNSFLEREKVRLSKRDYKQEYMGEFVDSAGKVFPEELLKTVIREYDLIAFNKICQRKFLGIDFARYGGDDNGFIGIGVQAQILRPILIDSYERKSLHFSTQKTIDYQTSYSFNRIITDEGGLGAGPTDELIAKYGTNKVLGINNASASESKFGRRILKDDMYSNAIKLLENTRDNRMPRCELPNNLDLLRSLSSVEFEETDTGRIKIMGSNTHLSEAFVRALWGFKEKGLKLFAHSF